LSLDSDAQTSDGMQVEAVMQRAKKATVLDKFPAA
jgi:hypothetical protein